MSVPSGCIGKVKQWIENLEFVINVVLMNMATSSIVNKRNYEKQVDTLKKEITLKDNMNIMDLLVSVGLVPSKSEARRLVAGNGISINGNKQTDPNILVSNLTNDNYVIISKGKKTHIKVNLVK